MKPALPFRQIMPALCVMVCMVLCRPALGGTEDSCIYFKRLRVENGLPNNNVYCACQDSQGFMWFGTLNGLARYDGYDTRIYRNEPGNPESLASNSVWNIVLDKAGNLWLCSQGSGVSCFNPRTNTFTRYQHRTGDGNSISSNNVWMALEDRKGRIWFATDNGLDMLEKDRKTFRHFSFKPGAERSLPAPVVSCLFEDTSGSIWVGTLGGGVCRMDIEKLEFNYFSRDANIPSLDALNTIWGFCQTADGTLRIGGNRGIGSFSQQTGTLSINYVDQRVGDAGEVLTPYSEVFPGQLWAAGSLGLDIFDVATGRMKTLETDASRCDRLSSYRVWSIYRSRDNLVWLMTDNGVDYFSTNSDPFIRIFRVNGSDNTLHGSSVRALHEDAEGRIWVGTERGLDVLYPQSGKITHVPLKWFEGDKIEDVCITDVDSDSAGHIWVSSLNGVVRYNPKTKESVLYSMASAKERRIDRNLVISLIVTKNSAVWFATKGGGLYEIKAADSKLVCHKPTNVPGESFGWINTIMADSSGRIWVTMEEEFAIYDPKSGKVTEGSVAHKDTSAVGKSQVFTVFEDSQGRFWLGTNQGLCQTDSNGKTMETVSVENGLPSNMIYSIEQDTNGSLWLGTDKGLAAYNRETGAISTYAGGIGMRELQYLPDAVLRSRNGDIYFGSSEGLVYFSPSKVSHAENFPDVVFTGFSINGSPVAVGRDSPLKEAINYAKEVTLAYEQNHLTVSFSALDYMMPGRIQYAYKLEGFDNNWRYVDARKRHATYTHLDPGHYTLKVKASNPDGMWGTKETELMLTILPPWWLTWWFKTALLLLAIVVVAGAYLWRVRKLKARSNKLAREVENRTADLVKEKERAEEALASEREAIKQNLNFIDMISHEYRTPLSVISSSLDLLEEKFSKDELPGLYSQLTAIRKSSQRLLTIFEASLTEKRVDSSGMTVNRENINVIHLVETAISFANYTYPDYEIRLVDETDSPPILHADHELLITVVSNIIDNACKYSSPDTPVTLTVSADDHHVSIAVEDKGEGIADGETDLVFEKYFRSARTGKKTGAGVGLYLVKKIVALHQGEISISSELNKGTTVRVRFPL